MPAKKKMGRPPLGKNARDFFRTVRFTAAEIEVLKTGAKRWKVEVSKFIRDAALGRAKAIP